jgi:hypothetical protein
VREDDPAKKLPAARAEKAGTKTTGTRSERRARSLGGSAGSVQGFTEVPFRCRAMLRARIDPGPAYDVWTG